MPPPKDNLTESLYRRRTVKKKPSRSRARKPGRTARIMALDPFFIATLVLVACAVVLQFFLILWLEFF